MCVVTHTYASGQSAHDLGIFGYTLVGSAAYLRSNSVDSGDVDAVLLAHGGHEPEAALLRLMACLQQSEALQGVAMPTLSHSHHGSVPPWYVQAIASLLKVVDGKQSLDLLYAHAPLVPPGAGDGTPTACR